MRPLSKNFWVKKMRFSFSDAQRGLVFGAGRGIGLGLVKALLEKTSVEVVATYRSEEKAWLLKELLSVHSDRLELKQISPESESDLLEFKEELGDLDFIINSIGLLHDEFMKPERKLEDINFEMMLESYKVNALISAKIAKVFFKSFRKKSPTLFSTVSAKVGSIEDNRLGGWYAYRASKAALNMILKNVAIEFNRRACHTSVVSIHPGTTVTDLSKPFIAKTNYKLHSPEDTGKNIIDVLDQSLVGAEAQFFSWDGEKIPW